MKLSLSLFPPTLKVPILSPITIIFPQSVGAHGGDPQPANYFWHPGMLFLKAEIHFITAFVCSCFEMQLNVCFDLLNIISPNSVSFQNGQHLKRSFSKEVNPVLRQCGGMTGRVGGRQFQHLPLSNASIFMQLVCLYLGNEASETGLYRQSEPSYNAF